MRYQWHHVEKLEPPKEVRILGLHSEWRHPLVVVLRRANRDVNWWVCGPVSDERLVSLGLSPPLHWARLPVGFAKE